MTKPESEMSEKRFRFDCARWDARYDRRIANDAWYWLSRGGFYPLEKQWPVAKKEK